jgi:hypothetical protein
MHAARQLVSREPQRDVAVERRQFPLVPLPLVELAHALEEQCAGRRCDARLQLHIFSAKGKLGVFPREEPEQRLLSFHDPRDGVHDVASGEDDAAALRPPALRAARDFKAPGPAVQVKELK